jgi:PBP1b-binding outer membrane lipoprotein LpoB
MKKTSYITLAAAMIALSFTGCSNTETAKTQQSSKMNGPSASGSPSSLNSGDRGMPGGYGGGMGMGGAPR